MKQTLRERWLPVENFEDYSVSNEGRIKFEPTGYIKKASINRQGILHVLFSVDGIQSRREVIRLVADSFLEPHRLYHFDTPINVNGDRRDNRVSNLMWRPRWFAVKFNKQSVIYRTQEFNMGLIDFETDEYYPSIKELAFTQGLLISDIIGAIDNNTHVFPNGHRYRWDD